MKYKIGDKVKIVQGYLFAHSVEKAISDLKTDRIVTIQKILPNNKKFSHPGKGMYTLKEIGCYWDEEFFTKAPKQIKIEPINSRINNRFEILDL